MKATRLILLTLTLGAGLGNAAAAPALRFEGGLHAELDGGARVIVHGRISSAAAAPSDPFDRATIVQGRPATAAGKPLPPPLTTGTAEHTESSGDSLASSFRSPPNESKPWCYWWWLNGAASKEGITRDFEEMRRQGISGALLFDAGEAGPEAPRGPPFMSAEWRGLYQHAVREADRCGLALGVNLCSGWNAGGPWVTHEHAAKKLVSAQAVVQGPGRLSVAVPKPPAVQEFYRDIAVLAAPIPDDAIAGGKLLASSQYQHYGSALAEDGDDESRWVSNGGKPGLGPTPEKPEFLQFDLAKDQRATGKPAARSV